MKKYPTKFFANTMQGAPQVSEAAVQGQVSKLLKAVLVDGFGSLSPELLVWDEEAGLAKATFNAGHAYHVDSIIACSGATPIDYNGEHRVIKVDATTAWFELDTVPAAASTGVIEVKVAPLGWALDFEDATHEKMIFSTSGDIGNISLRIDNSAYTGWDLDSKKYACKVQMVENVVDLDTFDLILESQWLASTFLANTGNWDLIGDLTFIYLIAPYSVSAANNCFIAGYLNTVRSGDRYHFILNGIPPLQNDWKDASAPLNTGFFKNNEQVNNFLARSYTQEPSVVACLKRGMGVHGSDVLSSPVNRVDNGFYINTSLMAQEINGAMRGTFPLLIEPLSNDTGLHRFNLKNVPLHGNSIFRFIKSTAGATVEFNSILMGFDITGEEV